MEIIQYSSEYKICWDNFINKSKNGLFIYFRDYMEYHSDRFIDNSLIILKEKKIIAVFPANIDNQKVVSHGGLTFGGLIYNSSIHSSEVIEVLNRITKYYKNNNVNTIIYKSIPYFLHQYPAQEDLYAIYLLGGKIIKRDLSSIIHFDNTLKLSDSRKNTIKKAIKNKINIVEVNDISEAYSIIEETINKYNKKPTHTLNELLLLKSTFPRNIRVYGAYLEEKILACCIIYIYQGTVHTQYLANSSEGKKIGALDYLVYFLIEQFKNDFKYFSFGISTENNGLYLNEGLIWQKEGFGARGVTIDTYEISI